MKKKNVKTWTVGTVQVDQEIYNKIKANGNKLLLIDNNNRVCAWLRKIKVRLHEGRLRVPLFGFLEPGKYTAYEVIERNNPRHRKLLILNSKQSEILCVTSNEAVQEYFTFYTDGNCPQKVRRKCKLWKGENHADKI